MNSSLLSQKVYLSTRNKPTCNSKPGIPLSHLWEEFLPFVTTRMRPVMLKEISHAQTHKSRLIQLAQLGRTSRDEGGKGPIRGHRVSNVLVSTALQGDHRNST